MLAPLHSAHATYTDPGTPALYLNGTNASPSGTWGAPPGTGVTNAHWMWNGTGHDPLTDQAFAYDLANDVNGEGFHVWTVNVNP